MADKQNKVALVTGASSGIGHASATRLARAGYRVFGTSRRAVVGSTVDGIEQLKVDVTSDASVEEAIASVIALAGRIDVLVNNAGIGIVGGGEESSTVQAQALFDTNVFGPIRMTRAVIPHMRRQGSGRIINISSVLGFLPAPFMALYASSKHALEGYSESLDHELRTIGVRVLLVEPAYTNTPFDQNGEAPDAPMPEYDATRSKLKVIITKALSIGDAPGVVAEAVLKAATDSNPRLRYPAGSTAKRLTMLRRFAPASAVDKGMRKQLSLDA